MEDYLYLTNLINAANKHKGFKAGNYGYNSTEQKCLNHVGKLLDSFSSLSTWNLKEGSQFFDNIKYAIIDFMEQNGFKLYVDARDNYKFMRLKE